MINLSIDLSNRCAIVRLLEWGTTLVKSADEGRYVIDLKNNPGSAAAKHKVLMETGCLRFVSRAKMVLCSTDGQVLSPRCAAAAQDDDGVARQVPPRHCWLGVCQHARSRLQARLVVVCLTNSRPQHHAALRRMDQFRQDVISEALPRWQGTQW